MGEERDFDSREDFGQYPETGRNYANWSVGYGRAASQRSRTSRSILRNRENAQKLNLPSVAVILCAAVLAIGYCVSFLQTQARYTAIREETTYLESRLDSLRLENDAVENSILSSVDLEKVRDIAVNRLGMVSVRASQIVTYRIETADFVRQYRDVS